MTMRFDYGNGSLWLGDCLALMPHIADASVDMVLCDLPYGTTVCKWDNVIPFEPLWREYWRICKPNAAIVLTASQPFTSALVMSQINKFRYSWVWNKSHAANPLNAKKMPMNKHEDICIFSSDKLPLYNPQMQSSKPFKTRTGKKTNIEAKSDNYGQRFMQENETKTERYPTSDLHFSSGARWQSLHPTQKPVALFGYLIRTYTNPGDLVLDNCAGSGTTAVAAQTSDRRWLCIEKELPYYLGACGRIWKACQP